MNCIPGDLAMIVAPYERHGRGYFVTTVRLASRREIVGKTMYKKSDGPGAAWVCVGNVPDGGGGMNTTLAVADECLRPIRPAGDDEQDESKAWLPPVPTQTKEVA